MKNRILHVAGGVSIQKLYQQIFLEFSKRSYLQDVYVPCNNASKLDSNRINARGLHYCYKAVGSFLDRMLLYPKISKHFAELQKAFGTGKHIYCFAYTVVTDGSLAYRLKKWNGTPYSVFVRNTDINIFYKYFVWLRPQFRRVLLAADYINFPNPSYKTRLMSIVGVKFAREIEKKVKIVPNGIDDFWHEHRQLTERTEITNPIQLLFVGKVDQNKNVDSLIKAVNIINNRLDCKLTIIGAVSRDKARAMESWQEKLKDRLDYKGRVDDKHELLRYYRSADIFVMPSLTETFGLVYIEALSQGLPIVYTKGEGISGFFENKKVGLALDSPKDENEIAASVLSIAKNYCLYTKETVAASAPFSWAAIIDLYSKQIGHDEKN